MTREQTLRETLAHNLEAAGYLALAKSARGNGLETFVSTALAFADAEAAAMRERAAIAARDAMCDQEWPPTDGDRQIDEVLAAIRVLPATGEVGRG